VNNYSQNNKDHLDSIRLKFGQRISDSLDSFRRNLDIVKEKMEEKQGNNEQKMVEKFEKWVKNI
jgi:hypothetical protein